MFAEMGMAWWAATAQSAGTLSSQESERDRGGGLARGE
jgi:hypothetical protein